VWRKFVSGSGTNSLPAIVYRDQLVVYISSFGYLTCAIPDRTVFMALLTRTPHVFPHAQRGPLPLTHEEHLHAVRDVVVGRLNDEDDRRRLLSVKIGYGSGDASAYGVCHYGAWSGSVEFIDIVACTEESPLQLAATLIHELAHVKAGYFEADGRFSYVKVRFIDKQNDKTFRQYALSSKGGWVARKMWSAPLRAWPRSTRHPEPTWRSRWRASSSCPR